MSHKKLLQIVNNFGTEFTESGKEFGAPIKCMGRDRVYLNFLKEP